MKDVRFIALGGAREIGANSFYYYIDGYGLLIDGGLHPEKTGWDAFPKLELLEKTPVDTFLVTHAHTDHLGAAPYVMQKQPGAKLHATEETIELARIMLGNSAGLLPKQHPKEVIDELVNYQPEALENVLAMFEPLSLGASRTLRNGTAESTISVKFFPSGHILGAAGVLIEGGGKRIFHTGDTSLHEQHLIAGAQLPEGEVDVLVTESTNGLTDAYITHDRDVELQRLLDRIKETLEGEGSVMIPVFALGKMQEILSMLYSAMKQGKIPEVEIYTGGMARKISQVYDNHKNSLSRTASDDSVVDIPQADLPRRDGLFSGKYWRVPSIVLASSGMMQEGTASYLLAQRWLREKNFAICFVGYTDPRTPGFVVSHAQRGQRVRFGSMKRDVPVRCTVDRFRFSAHARREELLQIIERLKPKQVVLTHGDEQAMAAFSEMIKQQFPDIQVSAPYVGRWYQLVGEGE